MKGTSLSGWPATAMTVAELLRWQWDGYPRFHRSRANLLLHIVAVPAFVLGNAALVVTVLLGLWAAAAAALAVMALSMAVQGRGHKLEDVPPEPFTGPANALSRVFLEQWVTFPGSSCPGSGYGHSAADDVCRPESGACPAFVAGS